MEKNENLSSNPEMDENMDKFVEEPEILDDNSTNIKQSELDIPQVDPAISSPEVLDLLEEKIEESETIVPEQTDKEHIDEPFQPIKPVETESKTRRVIRKVVRWVTGLLIIFGLGFLTAIFMFYRPAINEAKLNSNQFRTDLSAANVNHEELNSQIEDLKAEISALQPLKNSNDALFLEKQDLNLHIAILDARVDISNARLALKEEDYSKASVVLDQTPNTLDKIRELLDPEKQEEANDLKQRLEQVLEEIVDNLYAAESDLDVLENDLFKLQDSLFGD